jgi:hypothetical protein
MIQKKLLKEFRNLENVEIKFMVGKIKSIDLDQEKNYFMHKDINSQQHGKTFTLWKVNGKDLNKYMI